LTRTGETRWVYPIDCRRNATGNECEGGLGQPVIPPSFVALLDRLEVVEYSDGDVMRLKGCVVVDWQTSTLFR
jgi:hypothetical protein